MGKNSPSHVLQRVFKDISSVENIIKDSKKIEKSCKAANFEDQTEVDKIVADTKTIVDSLRDKVIKIDKYFDESYQSWKSKPTLTADIATSSDRSNNVCEEKHPELSPPDEASEVPEKDTTEIVDKETTKIPQRKAAEVPEKDTAEIPEKEPTEIPEQAAAAVLEKEAAEVPEKDAVGIPEKEPTEIPEKEAAAVLEKEAAEVPEKDVVGIPEKEPTEIPEKEAAAVLEKEAAEVPEKDVVGIPEKEPTEIPEKEAAAVLEKEAAEVPEKDAPGIPEKDPVEIPEKEPTEIPEKEAAEVPEEDATEMPEKEAIGALKKGATKVPKKGPTKMPEKEAQEREDVINKSGKESDDNGSQSKNSDTHDQTDLNTTENCIDAPSEASDKSEAVEPKVFIKCVDIKKLVNPNVLPHLKSPSPTRNNGFSDSILIISDSDQENVGETRKRSSKTKSSLEQKTGTKTGRNLRSKDDITRKNTRRNLLRRELVHAKSTQGTPDIAVISDSDSDSKENKSSRIKKTDKEKAKKPKETKVEPASDSKSTSRKNVNKENRAEAKQRDRPKKTLDCSSLSDTSSTDGSDSTAALELDKSVQKKSGKVKKKVVHYTKNEKRILDAQSDKKFSYKAYVPLLRIPCHKLKQFYLKKMELDAVKRLTNLDNLKKRPRRSRTDKNEGTSSDTENVKPKSKKKRKTSTNSHTSDADSSSEEANSPSGVREPESTTTVPVDQAANDESVDDQTVKMILDGITSGTDASAKESETEDDETKKNTKKGDKKSNSSEKTSNGKRKGKKSDSSASDTEKKKEKKKWRKNKLLTGKISESDSEEEFAKFKKRNEKAKEDLKARLCKKRGKNVIDSDSDSHSDSKSKKKNSDDEFKPAKETKSSSSDSESEKEEKDEEDKSNEKKRRRIKRVKDSSSEEDKDKSTRKTIRRVIGHESLAESTKQAEKDEKERKARIAERQKKYNQMFDDDKPEDATVDKVVLDFDDKSKEEILAVDEDLVKKLKPHQAKGVQFMWDACYESVERSKKTEGSGCILAHCMGLGKTLQVITLTHTLLINEELTGVKSVLVVCPLNTVLNWVAEFKKWLDDVDDGSEVEVYELIASKQNAERQYQVQHWSKHGGVLIIGYDMFRNLTNPTNKRLRKSMRETFYQGLVNPGPDLVVCDEGHLLKNEKSNISIAMNRIRTVRRIVLTGTPMQNNLKEYYCMVQFVKPNLLGTYKEYLNRFVNPITNGQYTDSTPHDIIIMRKRSHVLHKLLDGLVQRKDYSVLTPYLPPKHEYVLFLNLTDVQIQLYQHYKDHYSQRPVDSNIRSTAFLFMDFQEFQRICTHPRVLLNKSEERKKKAIFEDDEEDSEGSLKDFIDDDDSNEESSSKSSSSGSDSDGSKSSTNAKSKTKTKNGPQKRMTRNSAAAAGIDVEQETLDCQKTEENEWWRQYCNGNELDNIAHSSKLYLLFEILQQCELIGDKLLVFSQSLYSLTIIEYFLAKIDEATQKGDNDQTSGFSGSWALGLDYFRLDGSSSCDNRSAWCKSFNSPDNPRARLFLISTKAGGLGINLVGANRVIIFDVSWNPSHDIQSIYRIYRFGQTKPCYIYRFVTWGTMEMKIYERQVTKQAISKRVIDEQQIDRHYNQTDLAELYNFDPKPAEQPTPLVPKDVLLGELLQKEKDRVYKYHEHQSLLENKEDEELNEAERKAAWEEFENEKTVRVTTNMGWIKNLPLTSITAALASIIQKDNPTWTPEQVQIVIPTIVQQLREQVDAGQMLLFNRIVKEMRLMQVAQQQRMQEYYLKQQMQLFQQRYQNQPNAAALGLNFGNMIQSAFANQSVPTNSNEVVELND